MHMVGREFLGVFYKLSVKKHCVAKILQEIWEIFLYENNRNYNSYKFSYKFTFIPFLFFCRNQKQESNFQQVGGLETRILLSVYSGSCSVPYSIDF